MHRMILPVTLLALAVAVGSCQSESSLAWDGTMRDSAGVTMVSNTDAGIWARGEEWTLEEDLRIGTQEGDPEYQIGQVGSIALDSKGRIHVLDAQAQHIQVYSPDGIYQQTIGARGGGPGELGYAMALLIGPGDTLLVPDGQNFRFSRYAPNGASAGSIRLDPDGAWPMAFKAAKSGAIVEQIRLFELPGEPTMEDPRDVLVLLASDGSVTDTLMTFPSGKSMIFDGQYHFFEAEPLWDLTDYSQIVLGVNDAYRLGIYANGHLERIITKTFERKPVSDGDKAAQVAELERIWAARGASAARIRMALDRINFAEFLPAFTMVAVGPMNTIWVQPMRSPSELSEEEWASLRGDHSEDLGALEWDVFDAEGRFLGVATMPERFTPSLFRGDMIYGVWRDELNVEYVVRLRIVGDLGAGAT